MVGGQIAGIVALVVLCVLLVALAFNHRRLRGLRVRRDELNLRMAGLEARLGQLAEMERRQALARHRAAQPPAHGAPIRTGVRRVPPPRIPAPTRPTAPR
jgi:hypothetical protein